MADTPRFGIRFRGHPASDDEPTTAPARRTENGEDGASQRHDRVPIYRRALELAAAAHFVIELAEAERFFLRDQLDRKSSLIPQLVAQGLATADMAARRALFRQARLALTDCATIFDMMIERGSVRRDALGAGRELALALLDQLLPLTIDPPKTW
jgi:hypothetical protein